MPIGATQKWHYMSTEKKYAALLKDELTELSCWVQTNPILCPSDKHHDYLKRLIATYTGFTESDKRAKNTLFLLRQAMGFIAKSERGSSDLQSGSAILVPEAMAPKAYTEEERTNLNTLRIRRSEALKQAREYDRQIRQVKAPIKSAEVQLELDLQTPNENLFSLPVSARSKNREIRKVERMKAFRKTAGFHHTKDQPKRINLKLMAEEITYDVEILTDLETGKTVRASTKEDGPDGNRMTWGSIANLVKLHVGYAIPVNRLSLLIGQPEFSSGKICRILREAAQLLLPIYLQLTDELSDVSVLSGDDTKTKVLEPNGTGEADAMCDLIDAQLGWTQPRSDGNGLKKALNVSLIVGKPKPDPRSTIRFFRTHVGSVGNLLTNILESRNPRAGAVIFQGDLSSTNLPTHEIRQKTGLLVAGCGAHARRPFWRYRKDDESLCYYMLRGFLALAQLERRIDAIGRTTENVLKIRGKYGRWIWHALRNRCIAATTGVVPSASTYPRGILPNTWPPGTELHQACNYVIKHFQELTLYLSHPKLEYTNNGRERGLRIEKMMLSGSKFRKTKRGRVILDILRTINSTATCAHIDLEPYFCWVYCNKKKVLANPEKFTPYAFAQYVEKRKTTLNSLPTEET